jgi:hypothetical protein
VIRLREHAELVPPRDGDVCVSASVGPTGDAVALWTTKPDLLVVRSGTSTPGGPVIPHSRAPRPVPVRVTRHTPERVAVTEIDAFPLAHPHVQPLPDGAVLAVGARCRWRPEGAERNAIVYSADGDRVAAHTLGDGIQHVLATPGGELWVGYFDEGVVNQGWGLGDGPPPLGEAGLVRYSAGFVPECWYQGGPGWIADCRALNVVGDIAWACYYPDFPVVRVDGGAVAGWRSEVAGVRALAVDGDRVALFAGSDRVVLGVLGDGRLDVVAEHRVELPNGRPLPRQAWVVGRGADLHFVVGARWLRLAVEDLI